MALTVEELEKLEKCAEAILENPGFAWRLRRAADEKYLEAKTADDSARVATGVINAMICFYSLHHPELQNLSAEALCCFFDAEKLLMPERNRRLIGNKQWTDYMN